MATWTRATDVAREAYEMKVRESIAWIGVLILAAVTIALYVHVRTPHALPEVVVLQDKPQEWADALKLGLADGLRGHGFEPGRDVNIIYRSAAGDPLTFDSLSRNVVGSRPVAIYTLGTQSTQKIVALKPSSAVVFGAVTDPVAAGFYKDNLQQPRSEITGTQDLWPYPAQFKLIKQLVPTAKSVGILYNSSEVNSQVSVQHIRDQAKRNGLRLVEKTVSDAAQVPLAVDALIAIPVDVLFIPADNTVQAAAQMVIARATQAKVPVFTGIPGIVEQGALGTVGTNYYELGKVNAKQIAEILKGKKASKVAVQIADTGDLYLNLKTAAALNIAVTDDLKRQAVKLYY